MLQSGQKKSFKVVVISHIHADNIINSISPRWLIVNACDVLFCPRLKPAYNPDPLLLQHQQRSEQIRALLSMLHITCKVKECDLHQPKHLISFQGSVYYKQSGAMFTFTSSQLIFLFRPHACKRYFTQFYCVIN